ncbi:hypothetical protein HZH66_014900 [Vespula vulgaris]|uniref:Uncharacterized protein n=1 Tax=Vespula vulgaris TaxID=7454 RepID=A0A834J2V7_VESVU|nr:hypothetical protein HZH66_014900 [Vespula vulgaris]
MWKKKGKAASLVAPSALHPLYRERANPPPAGASELLHAFFQFAKHHGKATNNTGVWWMKASRGRRRKTRKKMQEEEDEEEEEEEEEEKEGFEKAVFHGDLNRRHFHPINR